MRITTLLQWLAVAALLSRVWLKLPLPAIAPLRPIPEDKLPGHPMPLMGSLRPNTLLRNASRMFEGAFHGAESVAFAPDGSLWALDRYGYAHVADPSALDALGAAPTLRPRPAAYVGPGRPLGFHFDASGRLLICDSLKGLTQLDPGTGALRLLANRASEDSPLDPGSLIHYANDLDVAADGAVYFSDSGAIPPALNRQGFYDTMASYLLTAVQGEPAGRLLVHRPATGQTHVLLPRLWFANGVALAHDESFVLVVETAGMRVYKHWLKGPRAGQSEALLENLPGFPDGLSRASDGNFWLALILPDNPLQRAIWAGGRFARWAAAWVLGLLPRPPARPWGAVVKISPEGEILQFLMDPGGSVVRGVSGVVEHQGALYMGHLSGNYVSKIELKSLQQF